MGLLRISRQAVAPFLPASGPPLGILSGVDWDDEETVVRPGETVLMFTDGIVEARSGSEPGAEDEPPVEYGQDRLEAAVAETSDRAPKDLITSVLADVRRFTDPLSPHDDSTMIALRYNGHGD